MKKILFLLAFFFILILAFLLRSEMFLNGDFYFLVDQSRDMLLAKSLVVDHKLMLIGPRTGMGGLFHGPLWIYMIAPFFALAKGNPFWTLVPLFSLVSMTTVVIGFFVGIRLYGKWIGLLFALLLTISAPLVQTVPFTTNAHVTPLVFLLYLYSIIQFMRGKEKYFFFALLFIGLGFQFESAFAILWVPLTLLAIILKKKLPAIKNILLGMVGFIIGVASFILFDLRHQFLMTKAAFKLITTPTKPLPGYEQYADLAFRFQDRVTSFWNSIFTPLFTQDTITKNLLLLIIITGILFLIKNLLITKKLTTEDKEYLFIIISPFVIYGLYIFYPLPLWGHYLLPMSILSIFILVLSIQKIFFKAVILKILIFLFIAISALPTLTWIRSNYNNSYQYKATSDGSYISQLEVAQWVLENSKNKEYGYFVYTTGILTYNMDYLLWWLSQKDHLIAPSNLKHNTTYLIMYPHSANDANAYDYWKKNVVRTNGKIIESKKFDSGISVEKLSIPVNEPPADPNYYQDLIFR